MSITVPVHLGYEFEVKAKAAEVFAVLADVPKSASHFPKVHSLTDLGDGAYQWDMEKVGTEHINIHTVYASNTSATRPRAGWSGRRWKASATRW
jgi:carbon monoxide dehydrogenase subunit G